MTNTYINYTVRSGSRFDQTKIRFSVNNLFNLHNVTGITSAGSVTGTTFTGISTAGNSSPTPTRSSQPSPKRRSAGQTTSASSPAAASFSPSPSAYRPSDKPKPAEMQAQQNNPCRRRSSSGAFPLSDPHELVRLQAQAPQRDARGSSAAPAPCWPAAAGHPSAAGRSAGTPALHSSPVARPPADRPASIHRPSAVPTPRRLGTDAEPIDPIGGRNRSIGLHRNFKAALVQRVDERPAQLQQRFASGADDKLPSR